MEVNPAVCCLNPACVVTQCYGSESGYACCLNPACVVTRCYGGESGCLLVMEASMLAFAVSNCLLCVFGTDLLLCM